MLGKEKDRRDPSTYDVFIVGECIRSQLNKAGLIKDRRYRFRKYRNCFVGREAIDWLVKMCHAQSRGEAILAMRCLQDYGMLHHVVDDHVFKDQSLFYRFTRDDDHYLLRSDLANFYHGLHVFCRVKESKIQRDFYHRGHLCQGAFYGADLVDCLVANDDKLERSDVIQQCRQLLEFDIIRHVTDDYHFSDDQLMYQFHVDYDRPCLLSDVLQAATSAPATAWPSPSQQACRKAEDSALSSSQRPEQGAASGAGGRNGLDSSSNITNSSSNNNHNDDDNNDDDSALAPSSHSPGTFPGPRRRRRFGISGGRGGVGGDVLGGVGGEFYYAEEEEEEGGEEGGEEMAGALLSAPFGGSVAVAAAAAVGAECWSGERGVMVKRVVKMHQDEVGYGFVLRGSSPCYVHTVDPLGPAAAAGLKEGQYVLSVNGQSMKKQDHRYVGRLVMAHTGLLTLLVLTQTNV